MYILKKILILALALGFHATNAQEQCDTFVPLTWGDWQTCGVQGDGTYLKPVIPADFSDIDCIEHDGSYYAISSTFQF